ncbi:hypothetical protein ACU4GD_00105 [Cupriavidus basilensis]
MLLPARIAPDLDDLPADARRPDPRFVMLETVDDALGEVLEKESGGWARKVRGRSGSCRRCRNPDLLRSAGAGAISKIATRREEAAPARHRCRSTGCGFTTATTIP